MITSEDGLPALQAASCSWKLRSQDPSAWYLRPLEFSHEVLAFDEGGTHSLPPSLPQPWATFNVPSTEGGVQCHWGAVWGARPACAITHSVMRVFRHTCVTHTHAVWSACQVCLCRRAAGTPGPEMGPQWPSP